MPRIGKADSGRKHKKEYVSWVYIICHANACPSAKHFRIFFKHIGSGFFEGFVDDGFSICDEDAEFLELGEGIFPVSFFAGGGAVLWNVDVTVILLVVCEDVEAGHEDADVCFQADDDEGLREVRGDFQAEVGFGEAREGDFFNADGVCLEEFFFESRVCGSEASGVLFGVEDGGVEVFCEFDEDFDVFEELFADVFRDGVEEFFLHIDDEEPAIGELWNHDESLVWDNESESECYKGVYDAPRLFRVRSIRRGAALFFARGANQYARQYTVKMRICGLEQGRAREEEGRCRGETVYVDYR